MSADMFPNEQLCSMLALFKSSMSLSEGFFCFVVLPFTCLSVPPLPHLSEDSFDAQVKIYRPFGNVYLGVHNGWCLEKERVQRKGGRGLLMRD